MDTRSFRRRRGAATLVGLLLLSFSVAARAGELLGERLEETTGLPPGAGQELGEREMGELRGGFVVDGNFLAYFSIDGVVASAVAAGQNIDANFHVQGSFDGQSGTAQATYPGPDGTSQTVAVTGPFASASISNSFNGTGIFQVVQVPGNGNNVYTSMTINLAILQVPTSAASAVAAQLATAFHR